ncbi:MAG: hypothetical protein JSS46_15335 [Proteobacteria bacterium]|nr:hypothetical protein [Pseudomonadota bacterium]
MKRARRKHRTAPAARPAAGPDTIFVPLPKRRNPVARSPLLGKGGAHGKSQGALRRRARMELSKLAVDDEAQ